MNRTGRITRAEAADADAPLVCLYARPEIAVARTVPDVVEILTEDVPHHLLPLRIAAAGDDVAVDVNRQGVIDPRTGVVRQILRLEHPTVEGGFVVKPVGPIR